MPGSKFTAARRDPRGDERSTVEDDPGPERESTRRARSRWVLADLRRSQHARPRHERPTAAFRHPCLRPGGRRADVELIAVVSTAYGCRRLPLIMTGDARSAPARAVRACGGPATARAARRQRRVLRLMARER